MALAYSHHPGAAASTKMRAAVLQAPGRFELREVELPPLAAGQVLVRLQGCGVCSSSLPLWEGRPWFTYPADPGSPGHEGWGVVESVADGVTGFGPGDRVALLSYRAFAELDVADESSLVRLPAGLAGADFPAEAFGCGFNVFSRARILEGETVAVVGVGFLGALLVQLAKDAGAVVVAVSRRRWSLELAERLGADLVFALDDPGIDAGVRALTGGRGCECVVEATGLQQPLDLASSLVATRGRLVVAGYHQDGPRQVDMQSWNWRGIDVVNAHERESAAYVAGMQAAAAALARGAIDASALLTHRLPLERIDEALELVRTRPEGFVKAVVTP